MSRPARAPSTHPAVESYARHVNPAFVKLLGVFGYGRVFVKAEDVWLWDHDGRQYLDALAAFGAANVGHSHPRLVARLQAFLGESVPNLLHVGPSPQAAALAEGLAKRAGEQLSVAHFASGGGEAVDAALKLARAATGRTAFVSCRGGYHGTTLGTLSIMGETRMREPFEPLLANCAQVPFGDLDALQKALSATKVAAFVVEPVLGEGGALTAPDGYLAQAQALCRKKGALLVLDEIQTGLGRTGSLFAYEQEGFVPDVLVLGKSLGGGVAPVSVVLCSRDMHDRAYGSMDRFDLHSSTFAGNAFGCAAALETLAIVDDEQLSQRARERGNRLISGLRAKLADHPLVRAVRGRGLLVGIELGPTDTGLLNRLAPSLVGAVSKQIFGQWAAVRLLEEGIVAQPASHAWNVLKIEPPLTIGEAEIDRIVDTLAGVLGEYRDVSSIVADATKRIGAQALGGWSFR